MSEKLAVLLPAYNEEVTIEKVVTDFKRALPTADIYVYDNNSKDTRSELAKQAGAIVRFEPRQGKGNVVRSMFREIDADYYWYLFIFKLFDYFLIRTCGFLF